MAPITDEALARVNRYGMGDWLDVLFASLGMALPDSSLASGGIQTTARSSGLIFTLSRVSLSAADPRDELVLARLEGDATAIPPCGLNPTRETIVSATAKLSSSRAGGSSAEIASGDRRVSFFLDGGRIVELRFGPSMCGFDRFVIARLGVALDWRYLANR